MKRLSLSILLLLFFAHPARAASISSQLVQAWSTSTAANEGCTTTCSYVMRLPNASLSNNLLVVRFGWSYASTARTVSNVFCNADSGHSTWTFTDAGHDVLDTSDKTDYFVYYSAGSASGCTSITIVSSGATTNLQGDGAEYAGMATSSPVDTGSGLLNSFSGPTFSTNAFTPGTSGDLIDMTCTITQLQTGYPNSTSATTGFSGFTLLDPNIGQGFASQAEIQTTAASITPSMDFVGMSAGGSGICIAIAFKTSGGAGTLPTGVHIVQVVNAYTVFATSSVIQEHVFNTGDALLFGGNSSIGGTGNQWSSITDSIGNSFTSHDAGAGNPQQPAWALDCSATSGDGLISLSGQPSGSADYQIVEIAGLINSSHTACFDTTAAGTNTTASPYTPAPSITPSLSTDLVIAQIQEGMGPITGVTSPTAAVYDYPTYNGITDQSGMTNGGGFAICFACGTGSKTFTWTGTGGTVGWVGSAIALKAAAAATVKRLRGSVVNR